MKLRILHIISLLGAVVSLFGQEQFEVQKANFSSRLYNEFCPVLYKDKLVFCTDQEPKVLVSYEDKNKQPLLNLFSVSVMDDDKYSHPQLFDEAIYSPLNEGPASFSSDGKLMVYCANINVNDNNKSSSSLGLFFAEINDSLISNPHEFQYNSDQYRITMPCLSQNGDCLYFISDMPGGFGGFDIYKTCFKNNQWEKPLNLGNQINTPGNEISPFVVGDSILYFASDKHGSRGGKDLFVSRYQEGQWGKPKALEAPINSKHDDFGFSVNSSLSEGYFSSNRSGTDDIYKFKTYFPLFEHCSNMENHQQCFEFWDDHYPGVDSLNFEYEWEFSDGTKEKGLKVEHCFDKPGEYWAELKIIDRATASEYLTQSKMEFVIEPLSQVSISSPEEALVNESIRLGSRDSYLPELKIQNYLWLLEDHVLLKGEDQKYIFSKPGIYTIKLGVEGKEMTSGKEKFSCVEKEIIIKAE